MSDMTTASHASARRLRATNGFRFGLPISSSPSKKALKIYGETPRLAQVEFDRLEVREELSFVVARTATVQVLIAHDRLERRRAPFVQRLNRLHVVVAHKPALLDHERRAANRHKQADGGRVNDADIFQSNVTQVIREPLSAALNVRRMLRLRTN